MKKMTMKRIRKKSQYLSAPRRSGKYFLKNSPPNHANGKLKSETSNKKKALQTNNGATEKKHIEAHKQKLSMWRSHDKAITSAKNIFDAALIMWFSCLCLLLASNDFIIQRLTIIFQWNMQTNISYSINGWSKSYFGFCLAYLN